MVQYVRVITGPSQATINDTSAIIQLGVIGFGLYWLWGKVNQWYLLSEPYNYISAFYYYTIVVPIKSFGFVWYWLEFNGITPYPNLNFCFSIIGIIIYAFFLLFVISLAIVIIEKIGIKTDMQKGLMFLPALVAFFWFILSFIFSWLFSH